MLPNAMETLEGSVVDQFEEHRVRHGDCAVESVGYNERVAGEVEFLARS
jgi:hypothetical protein